MLLLFKRFSFYTFTKLLTSLSVLVFKKQNISICQKKASTMQKNRSLLFDLKRIKKRNNFFNCLSAFIVCSFSFITEWKFFSFCFTWTTKKKRQKLWGMDKEKKLFLTRQRPTDKENCRSAMTRVRSEKKTATRLTSKLESFFSLCFKGWLKN